MCNSFFNVYLNSSALLESKKNGKDVTLCTLVTTKFRSFAFCFVLFSSPVVPVKDPMSIERSNLLSMMKLSIKVLIQSSLSLGRTLDSEFPPLQQFFVVLEHCLKHGLKGDPLVLVPN